MSKQIVMIFDSVVFYIKYGIQMTISYQLEWELLDFIKISIKALCGDS